MEATTVRPLPGTPQTPLRRRWRWPWILLLLIVAGVGGYTWFTLTWSYSDGERVGVLQKLSRKGWLCKTYEGEIAMYVVGGIAPQIWAFSVRDRKVYDSLNHSLGDRVRLHYDEHRGIPTSCFGETTYFVDRGEAAPQ